jgi:hypothetical protein
MWDFGRGCGILGVMWDLGAWARGVKVGRAGSGAMRGPTKHESIQT